MFRHSRVTWIPYLYIQMLYLSSTLIYPVWNPVYCNHHLICFEWMNILPTSCWCSRSRSLTWIWLDKNVVWLFSEIKLVFTMLSMSIYHTCDCEPPPYNTTVMKCIVLNKVMQVDHGGFLFFPDTFQNTQSSTINIHTKEHKTLRL